MQTEKINYRELAGEDPPQDTNPPNGAAAPDATKSETPTPAQPAAPEGVGENGTTPNPATNGATDTSTGVAAVAPGEEEKTGTAAGVAPPSAFPVVMNGAAKVQNVALVNAVSDVPLAVADVIRRARTEDYKGSPAEKRKAVYADMERLRTQAIHLRDSAEEQRSGETPDEAAAKRLVEQAKQCEQVLSALSAVYDALLSRAERRAGRDGHLKALDRDPSTGKKWKGAYPYDPRRPEMKELYQEKTHPAHVFSDGAKLIRMDGGKYGLIGSLLLVIREAEQRAGESIPESLRVELLKGVAYDALERGHGIGAGYNRDAAWILELWSRETKTPLRLEDLPVRHPITPFEEWAEEQFPVEYEKARKRVGLGDANGEAAVEKGGE